MWMRMSFFTLNSLADGSVMVVKTIGCLQYERRPYDILTYK